MTRSTVLITGARRGIGRAVAELFASNGFDVALADIAAGPEMAGAVAACEAAGDLADIAGHAALLDAVEARLGRVHCLVNNAGVSVLSRGDLLDVTAESYDRCMAVNARGTFFLTQAVARRMLTLGPGAARSIITISSSSAVAFSVTRGEYCMSKAAIAMGTTLFAIRLAEAGIAVFDIQPGLIATEMTAPSRERYAALIGDGAVSARRWGEPADVARAALTAAQGLLPYTVGQVLRVDGGLVLPKY
jgi:NAD(P)-dependent dehydrogenase (short-subunit alcohol dehydrogenase family)